MKFLVARVNVSLFLRFTLSLSPVSLSLHLTRTPVACPSVQPVHRKKVREPKRESAHGFLHKNISYGTKSKKMGRTVRGGKVCDMQTECETLASPISFTQHVNHASTGFRCY